MRRSEFGKHFSGFNLEHGQREAQVDAERLMKRLLTRLDAMALRTAGMAQMEKRAQRQGLARV